MTREQLAACLIRDRMTELEASVRVLWFIHRVEKQDEAQPKDLLNFFKEHAISNPNRSRLRAKLIGDRRILFDNRRGFLRLRAAAMQEIDKEMELHVEEERPISPFVIALEAHLANFEGVQTRSFVQEAIQCVRYGMPRASIIMAWCGAVSVMQEHVFRNCLEAFNEDALENGLLKMPAKSLADIRDIAKESQFLECLARISIIDDATKRTLKRCLGRRNDVGHPSEVKLSEAAVADHIETLMLNVFGRFGGT